MLRTRTPAETLEVVLPLAKKCGITRIAEITGLDRIGIPVFSCIRPGAADGAISVYNGKGLTDDEARVSAVMEGIERYCAEVGDRNLRFDKYSNLNPAEALNPADLILPQGINPDTVIPWYPCRDVISGEELLLPAHAVFHPVPHTHGRFMRTSTNGIASGNTFNEAALYGICEVIERDAWSLVEASGVAGKVIDTDTIPEKPSEAAEASAVTSAEYLEKCAELRELLKRFSDNGVDVILRDITADNGIPTIAAVSDDVRLKDPSLLCIGMGTSLSPAVAAIRAVTETAQSRLTQIHGAREDTTEAEFRKQIGYERTKRFNRKWFSVPESKDEMRDFADIPRFEADYCGGVCDFSKELKYISERLQSCGTKRIFAASLSTLDADIEVVRVIVPGLESFAIDNQRMGERCRNAGRNRFSGSKSARK